MFIRNPYNYDVDVVSEETALVCLDKSLAKQEFKEECDINTIVERFGIGFAPVQTALPMYEDFTGVVDYQTALNQVRQAAESFMLLPAGVRANFDNDPQKLLEFVHTDGVTREMFEDRGLVEKIIKIPPTLPPGNPPDPIVLPT